MKCSNCSADAPEDSSFCPICGKELVVANAFKAQPSILTSHESQQPPANGPTSTFPMGVMLAAIGLILALLLAGILIFKYQPGLLDRSSVSLSQSRRLILGTDFSASASSQDKPGNTVTYWVENMFDGSPETAWTEGVPGAGIGEYIIINFNRPIFVDRLGMIVGYAKTKVDQYGDRFTGNTRVRSISVEINGSPSLQHTFQDIRAMQYLPVNKQSVNQMRIVITDVYPGQRWEDTSVSELEIWGY